MFKRKITQEVLDRAIQLRREGFTLEATREALIREKFVGSITTAALSKRLRKVKSLPPSDVGRPRAGAKRRKPSTTVTSEVAAVAARSEASDRPVLPGDDCTAAQLKAYALASLRWQLGRIQQMLDSAFAGNDPSNLEKLLKIHTRLANEVNALVPPAPPDPALDPANKKARDIVIAMIEGMIPEQPELSATA